MVVVSARTHTHTQTLVSAQIPGAMTAAELCSAFLCKKLITVKEEEFWSCWEVSDEEEMGESVRSCCYTHKHTPTHCLRCEFSQHQNTMPG